METQKHKKAIFSTQQQQLDDAFMCKQLLQVLDALRGVLPVRSRRLRSYDSILRVQGHVGVCARLRPQLLWYKHQQMGPIQANILQGNVHNCSNVTQRRYDHPITSQWVTSTFHAEIVLLRASAKKKIIGLKILLSCKHWRDSVMNVMQLLQSHFKRKHCNSFCTVHRPRKVTWSLSLISATLVISGHDKETASKILFFAQRWSTSNDQPCPVLSLQFRNYPLIIHYLCMWDSLLKATSLWCFIINSSISFTFVLVWHIVRRYMYAFVAFN